MTETKQRVVKNRYHYFLSHEFSAVNPDTVWENIINVPFSVDELIIRDVANAETIEDTVLLENKEESLKTLVAVPIEYVYLLSMDGIGTLCSFTSKCYTKLDTVYKLDGILIEGQQTFRLRSVNNSPIVGGSNISSYFVCHLEFISYEK